MAPSVYQQVTEDIESKIKRGLFSVGEKLLSRHDICIKYGISEMTAYKVQQELLSKNIVQKIPGKGFVIQSLHLGDGEKKVQVPISGICFCTAENTIGKNVFSDHGRRVYAGAMNQAAELNISMRLEVLKYSSRDPITVPPSYEKGEGIIVYGGIAYKACTMALFCNPDINMVSVTRPLLDKPVVMPDFFDGIVEILNYLESIKCRRILYAAGLRKENEHISENEGMYFFGKEAARRGLEHIIDVSGDYSILMDSVLKFNPDAVMFSHDAPALRFKRLLESRNLNKMPVITGFDDIPEDEPGIESLTTYRIDCEGIGAAAVNTLVENNNSGRIPLNKRVKGRIIIRDKRGL